MPEIGEVTIRDLKDVFNTSTSYEIKLYSYNGADDLSLGELLMAICLYRANTIEAETVALMNKMSETTAVLNQASSLANDIVNTAAGSTYYAGNRIIVNGASITAYEYITSASYLGISSSSVPGNASSYWDYDQRSTVYNLLKSKMDSLNSISQEDMIDLQSLINKRDQSYNLASNGVKLMLNSGVATANNI